MVTPLVLLAIALIGVWAFAQGYRIHTRSDEDPEHGPFVDYGLPLLVIIGLFAALALALIVVGWAVIAIVRHAI